MKFYETPKLVIISWDMQDIVTASGFGTDWEKTEDYKKNDVYGETWG